AILSETASAIIPRDVWCGSVSAAAAVRCVGKFQIPEEEFRKQWCRIWIHKQRRFISWDFALPGRSPGLTGETWFSAGERQALMMWRWCSLTGKIKRKFFLNFIL